MPLAVDSATVLQCYSATMLQCNSATVLQCYSATVLQCYSATVLQCYSATVLQCHSATVPQFYSATAAPKPNSMSKWGSRAKQAAEPTYDANGRQLNGRNASGLLQGIVQRFDNP
jgi:cytochrome c5